MYAATSQLHVQKKRVIKNSDPSSLDRISIINDQGRITYAIPTIVAPHVFKRETLSAYLAAYDLKKRATKTIDEMEHKIAVRLISEEAPIRMKAPDTMMSHGEMSCFVESNL